MRTGCKTTKPKKKILVVDDNPLNIEIVREVLEEDYNLKTVTTGQEALEIATDFQPDIVLLDIMMPDMDGYEVCRRLRANSTFRDTTVVMVSAKGMLEEKVAGYEVGADDYITKPFREDGLRESVEFWLRIGVSVDNNSWTLQ